MFLSCLRRAARRGLAFKAIVVGEGHHKMAAQERAVNWGSDHLVEFTGSVPHARIRSVFRSIDDLF